MAVPAGIDLSAELAAPATTTNPTKKTRLSMTALPRFAIMGLPPAAIAFHD
jgi:hypothetical protein